MAWILLLALFAAAVVAESTYHARLMHKGL